MAFQELKYFIFNKDSDYHRGFIQNMVVENGGIRPETGSSQKGIFISRVLDTGTEGMDWHRLRLRGGEKEKSSFRISIYATDERVMEYRGGSIDMGVFLKSTDIDIETKMREMEPWLQKRIVGQRDVLLHDVTGRYMVMIFEVYWQYEMEGLYDIQVFFPRQSWMELLPEVYYREDTGGFLERYLGIFQTMHEDLKEEVVDINRKFDIRLADGETLSELAGWLDVQDSYIWSRDQLRVFLSQAVSLFKRRGTKDGISDIVELFSGVAPYIVEQHQVRAFRKDRKKYEEMQRLYGRDENFFTVLFPEKLVETPAKRKALIRLIENAKPANMNWQLVLFKSYMFVGSYTYVGVNTVLGHYTGLSLDGHAALAFSVLDDINKEDEQ